MGLEEVIPRFRCLGGELVVYVWEHRYGYANRNALITALSQKNRLFMPCFVAAYCCV